VTLLRRLSLDLTGRLLHRRGPCLLDDPRRRGVKRTKRSTSSIAVRVRDHWTVKWGDLLQSSRKYLGEKGRVRIPQWIRDAIASNRPYDQAGARVADGARQLYDIRRKLFPPSRASQASMEDHAGVLGAAWCARSATIIPFERWTQNQYYQMSAFSRRWERAVAGARSNLASMTRPSAGCSL